MSPGKTVKFTSQLKNADFLKISLLLLFSGWRFYAVMALLCVGLVLLLANVTMILFLFVAVFVALYTFIMIVKATSKKSRVFYLPRKLSFTEHGITGKTQVSDETVPWEHIQSWKRLGSYYLIYFSREKFLAIPQRDIDAAGIDGFDEMLAEHIRVTGA